MEQLDLFAMPVKLKEPESPAPPASAASPPSQPGGRAFAERKIPIWSRRAAELRESRTRGDEQRAMGLEQAIANVARLAAGPDLLAQLKLRLAACQPYMHPEYQMMFNNGPIMAEVRARLEAQIRQLGGE